MEEILDINSGVEATGIATTNLPANTTLFTAGVLASNAAITPVTSINLGFKSNICRNRLLIIYNIKLNQL
jgi:hypothetical protein